MNLCLRDSDAGDVIEKLKMAGVSSRRWWEDKLHLNPVFGQEVVGPISEADKFYKSVFGVPFFSNLLKCDVLKFCEVIERETTR